MQSFCDYAGQVNKWPVRSSIRMPHMYAGEGRTGGSTYGWVLSVPKSAGNRSFEICLRCTGGAMLSQLFGKPGTKDEIWPGYSPCCSTQLKLELDY